MFKNFMHNELGITKDDIRYWIKESVREEVKKMLEHRMEKNDEYDLDIQIDNIIRDEIYKTIFHPQKVFYDRKGAFQDLIRKEIAKIISEKIKIEISKDEN